MMLVTKIVVTVCFFLLSSQNFDQVFCVEKMNRPKVLITNPTVPQVAFDKLKINCDVIVSENTKSGILSKVEGVDAIFWASKTNCDAEVLDRAGSQLKVIAAMSAGINNIDVAEVKRRGIKLANTPRVLDDAVADIAVYLTLGASRRSHEGRLKIEKGEWVSNHMQWMLGRDISGSTVGIVGLGNIGQAILKRLKAFQVARFLYTGHREKPEGAQLGAKFVSLSELAKESDFVIISCPLTNETRHMINDEIFAKMKNTSIIINIARGEIIDQDALVRALKQGKIFAAGLDVMTPEPLPKDHELLKMDNVVLLPHLGSATVSTRDAMADLAAGNILRALGDEDMFTPVE